MITLTPEIWAEMQISHPKIANAMRKDPSYKNLTLKFDVESAAIMAEKAEARKADVIANGGTVLGQHYSYEELLCLATITVKAWYDLPEGNIVQQLRNDVQAALAGVVSIEANNLKATIAELSK
jgi:hypothetical protein